MVKSAILRNHDFPVRRSRTLLPGGRIHSRGQTETGHLSGNAHRQSSPLQLCRASIGFCSNLRWNRCLEKPGGIYCRTGCPGRTSGLYSSCCVAVIFLSWVRATPIMVRYISSQHRKLIHSLRDLQNLA